MENGSGLIVGIGGLGINGPHTSEKLLVDLKSTGMHSDAYTLEMRYHDITRMFHDIMHMLWRHLEKRVKNIVDRSIDYFMAIAILALCNKMVRKYAPWWIFNILAFLEAPRDELSRDEPLRDEPSSDERVHAHVHRHDAAVVDDATVHAEAVAVVDAAAVAVASIESSVISTTVIDANATA